MVSTSKVSIQSDRKYPSDSFFTSGRWTVTDRKPCPTITSFPIQSIQCDHVSTV
jgi:hypothetical protein